MNTAITDFYFKLRSGNDVTLTNDEAERLYSVLLQQQESFAAKVAEVERLDAENDELRRRGDELSSAILTINKAKRHEIMIDGDDEPCYWQRKEWVEWIVGLANQIEGGA